MRSTGTRGRRRPTFWVGLVMIAAALGVLGWAAWDTWGTNLGSWQSHRDLADTAREQWSAPPDPQGEPSTDPGRPSAEGVVALIEIPRFGDDYVIPVLQGTTDAALSAGMGHFDDTAAPGQEGNFAVAGHRVTHGEPLRRLPDLRAGDEVIVETRDAVYTYRVLNDGDALEVTNQATWVLDPLPTNPDGGVQPLQTPGESLLTLVACAEVFHTDDRLIVFADLVETRAR